MLAVGCDLLQQPVAFPQVGAGVRLRSLGRGEAGLTGFVQARLRGLLGYQLAVCRVGFLGNEIADNTAREPPHNLTSS